MDKRNKIAAVVLLLILLLVGGVSFYLYQSTYHHRTVNIGMLAPATPGTGGLGWNKSQGPNITALAIDAQNHVWAAAEGNGLWRYDPARKSWMQFTFAASNDNSIYALAVDTRG